MRILTRVWSGSVCNWIRMATHPFSLSTSSMPRLTCDALGDAKTFPQTAAIIHIYNQFLILSSIKQLANTIEYSLAFQSRMLQIIVQEGLNLRTNEPCMCRLMPSTTTANYGNLGTIRVRLVKHCPQQQFCQCSVLSAKVNELPLFVASSFTAGLVRHKPLSESTTRDEGELRRCLSEPSIVRNVLMALFVAADQLL